MAAHFPGLLHLTHIYMTAHLKWAAMYMCARCNKPGKWAAIYMCVRCNKSWKSVVMYMCASGNKSGKGAGINTHTHDRSLSWLVTPNIHIIHDGSIFYLVTPSTHIYVRSMCVRCNKSWKSAVMYMCASGNKSGKGADIYMCARCNKPDIYMAAHFPCFLHLTHI
jgi:hypothetical protein